MFEDRSSIETLLTMPVLIKFDLPVQCRQHGLDQRAAA